MIKIKNHFKPEEYIFVEQKELNYQNAEWTRIMKLAEKAGLIAQAAGGVAILLHPNVQIEEGRYHKIQWMTGNSHRLKNVDVGDNNV